MPSDLKKAIYDSLTAGKQGVQAAFNPMRLGGPDAGGGLRAALFGGLGAATVPMMAMDEATLGVGNVISEDTGRAAAAVERAGYPSMAKGLAGGGVALGMAPFIGSMALDPEMGAAKVASKAAASEALGGQLRKAILEAQDAGLNHYALGNTRSIIENSGNEKLIRAFEAFTDKYKTPSIPVYSKEGMGSYFTEQDFPRITLDPAAIKASENSTEANVFLHELQHSMRARTGRGYEADYQGISDEAAKSAAHYADPKEARADVFADNFVGKPRRDLKAATARGDIGGFQHTNARRAKMDYAPWEEVFSGSQKQIDKNVQKKLEYARAVLPPKEYSEYVKHIKKAAGSHLGPIQYAVPIAAGLGVASQGEQ